MMLTVRGTPNPYYAPFYSAYMNNGCGLMGMAANGYDETGRALSDKLSKLSIDTFDRNICLLDLVEIKVNLMQGAPKKREGTPHGIKEDAKLFLGGKMLTGEECGQDAAVANVSTNSSICHMSLWVST
ncbi:hypothetical protein Tco_0612629 [Tanacetum coccineum]